MTTKLDGVTVLVLRDGRHAVMKTAKKKVLDLVRDKPFIGLDLIARRTKIHKNALRIHLSDLVKKRFIELSTIDEECKDPKVYHCVVVYEEVDSLLVV